MSAPVILLPPVHRLSVLLVATMVAGLCAVSTAATASSAAGHHRVSVLHAGAVVRVAPSRKEY